MKTKISALALGAALLVTQPLPGATRPSTSTAPRDAEAYSHQALAYVENQLDGEIALPNGKKIEPNGTIVGMDGSLQPMLPSQTFTLDGRVIFAPLLGGTNLPAMPISSETPAPGRTESSLR